MTVRLRVYEILAAPAHAWLWLVGRLCGFQFECGPTDEDGEFLGDGE